MISTVFVSIRNDAYGSSNTKDPGAENNTEVKEPFTPSLNSIQPLILYLKSLGPSINRFVIVGEVYSRYKVAPY